MDRPCREVGAVAHGAIVGDEFDRDAAGGERFAQGLGREEMTAGSPGGDEHGAHAHAARPSGACASGSPAALDGTARSWSTSERGRLRVTASRNPISIATETNDEPP